VVTLAPGLGRATPRALERRGRLDARGRQLVCQRDPRGVLGASLSRVASAARSGHADAPGVSQRACRRAHDPRGAPGHREERDRPPAWLGLPRRVVLRAPHDPLLGARRAVWPLSLKALERDEYTRLTAGYLPAAAIAFLDEIFKANSAILNALLGILNERVFDNGTERVRLPLISVIGASNEIPTAEELLALYDRFLVRYRLEPVSAQGFGDLLALEGRVTAERVQARLSLKVLEKIRVEAAKVRLSVGVRRALHALREWLQGQGVYVSDRRWLKIVGLLRVAAYTEGRTLVLWPDCWLLVHCVWSRPEQHDAIRAWFDTSAVELVRKEPEHMERLVDSLEQFATAPAARVHRKDAAGRATLLCGGRLGCAARDRPAHRHDGCGRSTLPAPRRRAPRRSRARPHRGADLCA
jgi:MoxR-like ATPase